VFAVFWTAFRERDWKKPIFGGRKGQKTPNASQEIREDALDDYLCPDGTDLADCGAFLGTDLAAAGRASHGRRIHAPLVIFH
jgi:hypothetical protein